MKKTLTLIALILAGLIWGIVAAQIKIQINDIQDTQKVMLKEMERQNYCITPKIPCNNI